ncbi:MAG TPA: peptidyl-prolyl cis-trans isomerase [Steroidobacteraceae bacterium]|nr:peptidyl-prolyl cis-trans isomerase [Steroidobacteraceae bacterium]
MLQRIGDALTSRKWLTYTLFGALALIFAAWGAYGIATVHFGTGNNAAKVNGEVIPYAQVRNAWLQQQSEWQQRVGGEMPAAVKTELESQLLERFIRTTLMAEHTRKLGYRVSQQDIEEAIRQEPAFQLDGKYSPQVAKLRLQQAGISEQAYMDDLRQELRSAQVDVGIRDSDFLTPEESERIRALRNEEREVEYVVLPAGKFASAAPIDDKAVEAYYQAHKSEFMSPEFVRLQYAQLNLSQVSSHVQVSDADLHDYYDKHKQRYVLPERRRARHILIAVNDKRNDAAALARAEEVLAKLKAGGNFAALAKEYSDDPGSASQGGDLGWSERSAFVGPFADAVFSMKADEIRGPVKTQFGYHIIQLEGIQPGQTKTFEQARAEIEQQVRHDKALDRFGDLQEQIQQQLDSGSPTLEGLAKQFGLQTGEVPQFVRGTGGGAIGNSRELQNTVFGDAVLTEHRIGGPVLVNNDRLVLVKALEHHMPAPKPIAQVRDTIVAAIRKDRENAAALAAAQDAAKKLESGAAFDGVARDLGVKAEPLHYISRTDPSVPADIRSDVFASPKPQNGKPVYRTVALDKGGAALIGITNVKTDTTPNPQSAANSRREQADRYGEEAANGYLEQLRASAKVEKNLQVFEQ